MFYHEEFDSLEPATFRLESVTFFPLSTAGEFKMMQSSTTVSVAAHHELSSLVLYRMFLSVFM